MSKVNWVAKSCGLYLLWATTAIALPAQTFTTLYSFCAQTNCTDGDAPVATLVQGTDGNLYGTTIMGGTKGIEYGGFGVIFAVGTNGSYATVHDFDRTGGSSPVFPYGALIQAGNGNFYGTTWQGGTYPACENGCGTLFQIALSGSSNLTGTFTTIYNFCPDNSCANGANPMAGLVEAANGYLYGTAGDGGLGEGYGTIYKTTPDGAVTTVYSFCAQGGACLDGSYPTTGLIQVSNEDFYGTTSLGGNGDCPDGGSNFGCGTIFKITPNGKLTTLHSFNLSDGEGPSGLVLARNGEFYGTTYDGGVSPNCPALLIHGCGTVFEITQSGTFTTLYNFCSQGGSACTDGSSPEGLIQGTDGNLYGATALGGSGGGSGDCSVGGNLTLGCGTLYKISPSGSLTTLYNFCTEHEGVTCEDGEYPGGEVIQDTDGAFYGTTQSSGRDDGCCGTVFSLNVGLPPFAKTQPTSGKIGAAVNVLGSDLTGATRVAFNGTAAVFTVVSPSLITTTVPSGATSGKVQVVTPTGTVSSNTPFFVRP
jgi:uncharacterized repeat protein (TIGR03803 family)